MFLLAPLLFCHAIKLFSEGRVAATTTDNNNNNYHHHNNNNDNNNNNNNNNITNNNNYNNYHNSYYKRMFHDAQQPQQPEPPQPQQQEQHIARVKTSITLQCVFNSSGIFIASSSSSPSPSSSSSSSPSPSSSSSSSSMFSFHSPSSLSSPSFLPLASIIVWRKNGAVINPSHSRRYKLNRSSRTLTINNLNISDSGHVTCESGGSHGGSGFSGGGSGLYSGDYAGSSNDYGSFHLIVADVPDPPTNVRLMICDGRVAQLQWNLANENNSPVKQFIIQTNSSFKPDVWETLKSQLPRNRTHQRVTLSPWGNYTFRVLAENAVGMSRPSMVTSKVCTTEAEVPRINPQGVCTVNYKPFTLFIKWDPIPPEEQNGPGFHYLVSWNKYSGSDRTQYEKRVNSSSSSLLVTGVPIYTLYDIYVTSVNEMGPAMSPQRSHLHYSGEDVPLEIPQNFGLDPDKTITDRSASFVWSSVNTAPWRIQGHYMGYKIQYWKTNEGRSTKHEHSIYFQEHPLCWNIDASTITGFTRHKRFADGKLPKTPNSLFKLAAVAANKSGRFKIVSDAHEPLKLPATLKLSEKLAKIETGNRKNCLPRSNRKRRQSTSVTHGHVYNLWPYSNITAQVVVMNVKYTGPPSLPVHFTTREGKPGPLESFTVVGQGISYLMLMWTVPREKNGILLSYTLTYTAFKEVTETTEPPSKLEIVGENNTLITLTNLLPDYRYSLTVCARTSVGCGPASSLETFTLVDGPPTPPEIMLNLLNDDRLLNVTWYTPTRGHQPPIVGTTYFVNFRKSGESKWTTSKELTNTGWYIISGLEGGVTYEIRVTSRNGDKDIDPVSYSNIKKMRIGRIEDYSNQPSFRVWYGDSNYIRIGLEHTDIHAIKSYRVEYRYLGANHWSSTPAQPSLHITNLDDLTSGGRYEVRVVVTMVKGDTMTSHSKLVVVGRDGGGVQAPFSFPNMSNRQLNISPIIRMLPIIDILITIFINLTLKPFPNLI